MILAAGQFARPFELRWGRLVEELTFVAEVTEIAVESTDDFFERLQAAGTCGLGELKFLESRLHLAVALLYLSGTLSQPLVLRLGRHEGSNQDRRGER